jgi:sugar phosphate isomerase/epimerase
MPKRYTLGGNIDDFQVPAKEGFQRAAELGLSGVEFGAAVGDLSPENLSRSGRKHVTRLVEGLGLRLTSLVADMPGLRLTDPKSIQERIDRTCRIVEMSLELGIRTVSAAAGSLTHPETGEPSELALDALSRIGEFADSRGVVYAVRCTHDGPERIGRVLSELGCPALGLCLDPAALVMGGLNPAALAESLHERIRLVHARDATAGGANRPGHETRFGEGEVDWVGILDVLGEAGYRGAYVLRRTDSQSPLSDLETARDRIVEYLSQR